MIRLFIEHFFQDFFFCKRSCRDGHLTMIAMVVACVAFAITVLAHTACQPLTSLALVYVVLCGLFDLDVRAHHYLFSFRLSSALFVRGDGTASTDQVQRD
jgi:hypothetical protein